MVSGGSRRHDAIIVGAGHNGLVAACYLARAGLDVLVLERNAYIGGAAVSRSLHDGFTYSNCSYVCSLLRTEIIRELNLPGYGLQIIPYEGGCTMMRDGGHLALYDNHDALRREIARHSKRDAESYDRYLRDMLRQCRFIKPLLLREPPDPTSFKPRDIMELLYLGKHFHRLGEQRMYDTVRFWTMSCADFLDQYFESEIIKAHLAGSSIIGTALGPRSPGTAYVLLHHYMGNIDGAVGAWGFARGGMGAVTQALAASFQASGGSIRSSAPVEQIVVRGGRACGVVLADGEELQARIVVSNLDVRRTFLDIMDAHDLPEEFVSQVRNFKIRGSSGKLNIALDGLPHFPGDSARLTEYPRRHARDRQHRDARARLRRLEGGPLVAGAVHRYADAVADRSDPGAERQALYVGVRAVLSVPAGRRPVGRRQAPGVWPHRHRYHCRAQSGLQGPDPACRDPHALGSGERGRADRGQYFPGRADL